MLGIPLTLWQGGFPVSFVCFIPSQVVESLSGKLLRHENQSLLTRERFVSVLGASITVEDLRELLTRAHHWSGNDQWIHSL